MVGKIKRILIGLLLFIPFLVYAQTHTFNEGVEEGNGYINLVKYQTRNKYLLLNNNLKFVLNNNGEMSFNNKFINGGFLNYREFCLSTGSSACDNQSYLIIPNAYWTLSGSSTNRYYINNISGIATKSDNNRFGIRVTEFIKPTSTVAGLGTYSNPWYFVGNYYISLSTNSVKYAKFVETGTNRIEKYANTSCIKGSGYCTNFDLLITHGYENNKSDGCNLNLISKDSIQADGKRVHKYEISNITSDIECVALFMKKEFSISFNCNGGSGSIPTKTVLYDNNLTLPTQTCSKTGYLQDGWTNGNNEKWASGSTIKFHFDDDQIGIKDKKLDLKAKWIANTYYVKYNGNGNTGGSTATSTHTYDTKRNLTANGFTKTGYLFAGWATSSGGNVVYANNAEVLNLTATPNATVNLYAKWTPITYYVAYNGNGNTGGGTATSTHTYDVTKALTVNGFSKTGYTFSGWATSSGGGVSYGNGASVRNLSATNNATVNLYAKWTANTFTIAYNGNGANGGSRGSHNCTYDQNCTLQANGFTRTGYTFTGWKQGNSGNTLAVGTSVKNVATSGTVTYYAQWSANTFTVAYNGNGATGGSRGSHTCTYDQNCTLQANGFTRSGYTFAGWKRANAGNILGVGTNVKNTVASGTITYYAQWNYCGAGTYEAGGTCRTCPAGYYCTGGTAKAACWAGTYQPYTGRTASSACMGCGGCKTSGNAATSCSWNQGAPYNTSVAGYNGRIGVASNGSCITNVASFWGYFRGYGYTGSAQSSGNYGFEDWFSERNHGGCSASPLSTFGFERYLLASNGALEFTGGACTYPPAGGHVWHSVNVGARLSAGTHDYGFPWWINGEETIFFQIRNGGGADNIAVSEIRFNINGGFYTIEQMVNNGYVKPLVLYGAMAVYGGDAAINLYWGGSQGYGYYPDTFVLFTLNSGYQLRGFRAWQSSGSSQWDDGYYLRGFDPNWFRVVLK